MLEKSGSATWAAQAPSAARPGEGSSRRASLASGSGRRGTEGWHASLQEPEPGQCEGAYTH